MSIGRGDRPVAEPRLEPGVEFMFIGVNSRLGRSLLAMDRKPIVGLPPQTRADAGLEVGGDLFPGGQDLAVLDLGTHRARIIWDSRMECQGQL